MVFFIGAGFSIDSEHVTSNRLMARLLARFAALVEALDDIGERVRRQPKRVKLRQQYETDARHHEDLLRKTFGLDAESGLVTPENARQLEEGYFEANDWMVRAFGALWSRLEEFFAANGDRGAAAAAATRLAGSVIARLNDRENRLLEDWARRSQGGRAPGADRLPPIERKLLQQLDGQRAIGKALLLDTLGFSDDRLMGGRPDEPDRDRVADSYDGRLLRRHFVLARLAREGLCPWLLTTNFDLLLEGGFRMVGFEHARNGGSSGPAAPPTSIPDFDCVSGATEFGAFRANRSALIFKIHGCANTYRKREREVRATLAKRSPRKHRDNPLCPYLDEVVFGFREIQNWRDDGWSRDLVRTLLRTHTFVFCGYRNKDQVLHDTVRTVYEELASARRRESRRPTDAEDAVAFTLEVLDKADRKNFYGQEILRAASEAVGYADPHAADHPNEIGFFTRGDEQKRFPRVGETLVWLEHLVRRDQQADALERDLRRVAGTLLREPPPSAAAGQRFVPAPQAECEAIKRNFELLRDSEQSIAQKWTSSSGSRRWFERIVGWTETFHPSLLRELALADAVSRTGGPNLSLALLRDGPWYYPAAENGGWTAWGVVIEIAIRRMVARWCAQHELWRSPVDWLHEQAGDWLHVMACAQPTVAFSRPSPDLTPRALTIRLGGFDRLDRPPRGRGVLRGRHAWALRPTSRLPWPVSHDEVMPESQSGTPLAETLWTWAWHDQPWRAAGEPLAVLGAPDASGAES